MITVYGARSPGSSDLDSKQRTPRIGARVDQRKSLGVTRDRSRKLLMRLLPCKYASWLPHNDGHGPRTDLPLAEAFHSVAAPKVISPENIVGPRIVLGIILGVTPVLGSTMLLCTFAAILFRLNLPAIQLVNGGYPLQFILLIPFYRLGAWMFRVDASTISLGGVTALIREGIGHAVRTLWVVTMHALLAWLGLGMVALAVLYAVLVPLVRQLWRGVHPSVSSPYGQCASLSERTNQDGKETMCF